MSAESILTAFGAVSALLFGERHNFRAFRRKVTKAAIFSFLNNSRKSVPKNY